MNKKTRNLLLIAGVVAIAAFAYMQMSKKSGMMKSADGEDDGMEEENTDETSSFLGTKLRKQEREDGRTFLGAKLRKQQRGFLGIHKRTNSSGNLVYDGKINSH